MPLFSVEYLRNGRISVSWSSAVSKVNVSTCHGHTWLTTLVVWWKGQKSDCPLLRKAWLWASFLSQWQYYCFIKFFNLRSHTAQWNGACAVTDCVYLCGVQILHRLTARAVIDDWQHGLLSDSSLDQHVSLSYGKRFFVIEENYLVYFGQK